MSFWLESLSILFLQVYTFTCNFCSRKGGVLLGSAFLLGHIMVVCLMLKL